MGRVLDYANDPNINGDDKVLGTDSTTGRNKNYRIDTLVNYLNTSGSIGVLGQLGYVFNSESPALYNTFHKPGFGGDNSAISSLTNLVVSKYPIGGYDAGSYLQSLVGKNILLANVTNLSNWGVFTLMNVNVVEGNSDYYNIAITHVSSSGILEDGKTYGIAAEGLESTASWGNVAGTITDQTDLVDYITSRLPDIPFETIQEILNELNALNSIDFTAPVKIFGTDTAGDPISFTIPAPLEQFESGTPYVMIVAPDGTVQWREIGLEYISGTNDLTLGGGTV